MNEVTQDKKKQNLKILPGSLLFFKSMTSAQYLSTGLFIPQILLSTPFLISHHQKNKDNLVFPILSIIWLIL